MTGEIAIRNKYLGETSFFVLDHYDEKTVRELTDAALADDTVTSVLTGWTDYFDDNRFEAKIKVLQK